MAWGLKFRRETRVGEVYSDNVSPASTTAAPAPEPEPAQTPYPATEPTRASVTTPGQRAALNEGKPKDVAQRHAMLLVEKLKVDWPAGDLIPADTAKHEYGVLCGQLGIAERPWNPVATCLARLTRRKGRPLKVYDDWIDGRGRKKRRRVYIVPASANPPRPAA